ncbi:MAG: orotidine-5'-phosphate decarboxylase [Actinobacteria bacterium]|nr:orotidine-5'-phosphate decarboxylase [Actinomycetota bacterium]
MTPAPIAVALDAASLDVAVEWARAVQSHVSHVKIGLESYLRDGADGVRAIRGAAPGCGVFLDLKFHDIPATVAGASRSIAGLDPDIVTVHASGGSAMVTAAVEALPSTRVAAVTILTSLSARDLEQVGISGTADDAVLRLARMAVEAGARALVCSAQEVALVRQAVPADIMLITPGIRPADSAAHDQSRVATPRAARADGADLLVIGRPITSAADVAAAAAAIAKDLATDQGR